MIYTVAEIKEKVTPIALKYGIKRVYLFGSYARGDASEESDIDLLIDTTGLSEFSLMDRFKLEVELENVFNKKIDIVTLAGIVNSDLPRINRFKSNFNKDRIGIYGN